MSRASLGSSQRQSPYDDDVKKSTPSPEPFSYSFWQKGDQGLARARTAYFKLYLPGVVLSTLVILGVYAVFWGTVLKLPAHTLPGWIVDFDGGEIGQAVIETFSRSHSRVISWEVAPSSRFSGGVGDAIRALANQETWALIAINEGATARLESSISTPDAAYNASAAITAFSSEGRNENAFRTYIEPYILTSLDAFKTNFTISFASRFLTSGNITDLLSVSPQTVVTPVSYTFINVNPYAQAVATGSTYTGLIFVLIIAFFVVLIANFARQQSGIARLLTFRSLIMVRLASALLCYLFLSLLYAFLNLAFKVNLHHTYGHSGFVLFWMVTWVYMLAVGLVLESVNIIFKQYTPFFFITWLIINLSVGVYPIEMLPKIYHYGYGAPFYNIAHAVRSILFGTKNTLGLNFGVLIAWFFIGSSVMTAIQWYVRQQEVRALRKAGAPSRKS